MAEGYAAGGHVCAVAARYFGEPVYVFPATDCVMLPVENTTSELIAAYLAEQLRDDLAAAGYDALAWLEVEVEENVGQSATFRLELRGSGA